MKTEVVDVSQTRKELKIEIEAAEVRAELDRVSDRYARLAAVPGFRKGHAPRAVVRQRFKNEIRSEVVQNLVPQAIQNAVEEQGLNVIGEPDIHLDNNEGLEKLGEQPLSLHAHVEVLPDVTLGTYKGIEAARRTRPVTDEDVENVIQGLRESSASLQPVEERGAELGDTVTVDIQGRFVSSPEEEDMNVSDVQVVLGGEGVVQEFNDNLLGVRADDVKTFTVKYPEDFTSKGLAGKEIEYTATVTAVSRKELPELNDEWAQSLGEEGVDSVETLRARIRESLTMHARHESNEALRNAVLSKLVSAHDFEVPETLVNHQANRLLESVVRDMMRRGADPRGQDINWEGLGEMAKARASEDLRGSLLLERIADEENIEVSDEEIEAEINAIAQASRQSTEQVRAALTKQGGERSIADRLRNHKALDLIVENASVREEEWREEEDDEEDEPTAVAESSDDDASEAAPAGETASEAQSASGEQGQS